MNNRDPKTSRFLSVAAAALIGVAGAGLIWRSSPACAGESVEYHKFGGNIYGSDGSKIHKFSDKTYITGPHGKRTVCHDFSGKTYCESDD